MARKKKGAEEGVEGSNTNSHLKRADLLLIVEWLEKDDNREKVYGVQKKTKVGVRPAQRAKAYEELATYINDNQKKGSKLANLDGKSMKTRYRNLWKKYQRAKDLKESTGFGLTEEDLAEGIKTMDEKMESLCPFYGRLNNVFQGQPNVDLAGWNEYHSCGGLQAGVESQANSEETEAEHDDDDVERENLAGTGSEEAIFVRAHIHDEQTIGPDIVQDSDIRDNVYIPDSVCRDAIDLVPDSLAPEDLDMANPFENVVQQGAAGHDRPPPVQIIDPPTQQGAPTCEMPIHGSVDLEAQRGAVRQPQSPHQFNMPRQGSIPPEAQGVAGGQNRTINRNSPPVREGVRPESVGGPPQGRRAAPTNGNEATRANSTQGGRRAATRTGNSGPREDRSSRERESMSGSPVLTENQRQDGPATERGTTRARSSNLGGEKPYPNKKQISDNRHSINGAFAQNLEAVNVQRERANDLRAQKIEHDRAMDGKKFIWQKKVHATQREDQRKLEEKKIEMQCTVSMEQRLLEEKKLNWEQERFRQETIAKENERAATERMKIKLALIEKAKTVDEVKALLGLIDQ